MTTVDTRISIGPQTRVHARSRDTPHTQSALHTGRISCSRRVHTYDAASQHDTAFVEILLDLRSFSATTDALSLTHSLARQTPTECEREASSILRASPRTSAHFIFQHPSANLYTDDDDGEAALHFLAHSWAGPVEGSAPAAPGRAWCTADRRCHLVALRPRSWYQLHTRAPRPAGP